MIEFLHNRKLYQKIMLLLGIISILPLFAYAYYFISTCIALNNVTEAFNEIKEILPKDSELFIATKETYSDMLSMFFMTLGQLVLPILFSIACFTLGMVNISSEAKIKEQITSIKNIPYKSDIVLTVANTIDHPPYMPTKNVVFNNVHDNNSQEYKSSYIYCYVDKLVAESIINKKPLSCKSIDQTAGGIFNEDTLLCQINKSTHIDLLKKCGDYCLDAELFECKHNNETKDCKLTIKYYYPALVEFKGDACK